MQSGVHRHVTVLVMFFFASGCDSSKEQAPTLLERTAEVVGGFVAPGPAAELVEGEVESEPSSFVQSSILPALEANDGGTFVQTLDRSEQVSGVLVSTTESGDSVAARLARFEHVDGLSAKLLSGDYAFYARSEALPIGEYGELIPQIARQILGGASRPPLASFPPILREPGEVEVLVVLRDRGVRRLWRSARGTTIASALITASMTARSRWRERESALGGPLGDRLDRLDVEVYLIEHAGVLETRTLSFFERALPEPEAGSEAARVGPELEVHGFGLAFNSTSGWKYLLPRATAETRARGGMGAAVERLFEEARMPDASLDNTGIEFFRIRLRFLGAHSEAEQLQGSPGQDSVNRLDDARIPPRIDRQDAPAELNEAPATRDMPGLDPGYFPEILD